MKKKKERKLVGVKTGCRTIIEEIDGKREIETIGILVPVYEDEEETTITREDRQEISS